MRNADGVGYYGYRGDFGDIPNDGHFVLDGLLFSDHTPTPGLTEYKNAIEPIQVLKESAYDKIGIINRYDFVTLDHQKCEWAVVGDGFTTLRKELALPKGIKPGETTELPIDGVELAELAGECYVKVSFTLNAPTPWGGFRGRV